MNVKKNKKKERRKERKKEGKNDIPCCRSVLRLTLYFSNKALCLRKNFENALRKITIALPKKFGSKGFITVVKIMKI